jgi:hypothetical protein
MQSKDLIYPASSQFSYNVLQCLSHQRRNRNEPLCTLKFKLSFHRAGVFAPVSGVLTPLAVGSPGLFFFMVFFLGLCTVAGVTL